MSNIKYFYIRQPDKKNPNHRGAPVACVAYQRTKDPDVEGTELITFALSAVNTDHDEFTKARARKIATGRLTNPRVVVEAFPVEQTASSTEVIRDLVGYISDGGIFSDRIPTRVRNAAAKWLKKTKKTEENTSA